MHLIFADLGVNTSSVSPCAGGPHLSGCMSRFSIGFPVSSVGSCFLELHAVKDSSMKAERVGVRRLISDACRGRGGGGGALYKPFWAEASLKSSSHGLQGTVFRVRHRTFTPCSGSYRILFV